MCRKFQLLDLRLRTLGFEKNQLVNAEGFLFLIAADGTLSLDSEGGYVIEIVHNLRDELELGVDVPELALQLFHLLFSTVDLFVYAAQFQRMEVEGTNLLLQFLDIPVFGVDDHFNGGASRLAVDGR